MSDKFRNLSDTPFYSARNLRAITPHDTDEIDQTTKALYIGTGGTLVVIAAGDTEAVSLTVLDGVILPIRVKVVLDTGTTATGIVGLS